MTRTTNTEIGERMAEITAPYMAACIDCDGNVGIVKMKAHKSVNIRYELRLAVTNTDERLLYALQKRFGGTVHFRKAFKPNWKNPGFWRTQGANAENILREIYPYLVIKKERADVAFKLRSTVDKKLGSKIISTEIMQIRAKCYEEMKTLNKKGVTL